MILTLQMLCVKSTDNFKLCKLPWKSFKSPKIVLEYVWASTTSALKSVQSHNIVIWEHQTMCIKFKHVYMWPNTYTKLLNSVFKDMWVKTKLIQIFNIENCVVFFGKSAIILKVQTIFKCKIHNWYICTFSNKLLHLYGEVVNSIWLVQFSSSQKPDLTGLILG